MTFDHNTNLINGITNKWTGITQARAAVDAHVMARLTFPKRLQVVSQNWYWYNSSAGGDNWGRVWAHSHALTMPAGSD